jgi:hypothetical protein
MTTACSIHQHLPYCGNIEDPTQSRSTDTRFMIEQSFSTQAKVARSIKLVILTAFVIGHPVVRNQKIAHEAATTTRCRTAFQDIICMVPR